MKFKRCTLSLGVISLIGLPFITVACSRYSVQTHDEITNVLKKYAVNNKYLIDNLPPKEIKVPSSDKPIKLEYKYEYLAGAVEWSTTVDDVNYSDIFAGWKQYPALTMKNDGIDYWGNQSIIDISTELQLVLMGNKYIVQQGFNLNKLSDAPKTRIDESLSTLYEDMFSNTVANKWINQKDNQNVAILKAKRANSLPDIPVIKNWFNNDGINHIFGFLSITNPSTPAVNSNYIDYKKIPKTINDQKQFILNWAQNDKTNLTKMFSYFKNFDYADLINLINSIN